MKIIPVKGIDVLLEEVEDVSADDIFSIRRGITRTKGGWWRKAYIKKKNGVVGVADKLNFPKMIIRPPVCSHPTARRRRSPPPPSRGVVFVCHGAHVCGDPLCTDLITVDGPETIFPYNSETKEDTTVLFRISDKP